MCASVKTWVRNQQAIAYAYLLIVLPTVLLLCFLVPPMQVEDESRHFVRAYQIAEGGWIPEVDRGTGRVGGTLPNALGDFIRTWMASESRIGDETLHTVKSRMASLDRAARIERPLSSRRFLSFPSSAIYPPALYLPQAAGIRAAKVFSDKVYVSFYAARIVNAITAVLLVFLALRLLPQEALLLMFVMALPLILYHISSNSSDAGIISLSILLVALCIRFRRNDGVVIRLGLMSCLILLTMGKPVHLCFGILLLSVHERLGWKRAIRFFSLAIGLAVLSYLSWYYIVKDSMSLAGEGHGQNPSAQIHFITTHPISLILVVLRTLRSDWQWLVLEGIGRVGGWQMYPLPRWFTRPRYA